MDGRVDRRGSRREHRPRGLRVVRRQFTFLLAEGCPNCPLGHNMQLRYTRFQVPRGARADAESGRDLVIIKLAQELRATYQIRLLAFRAKTSAMRLMLYVAKSCRIHPTLATLIHETDGSVRVIRREQ